MTTQCRAIEPHMFYHVYNRGENKMPIYLCESDFERFISRMIEYQKLHQIEVAAYCLMPNHYHLLLREPASPPGPLGSNLGGFIHRLQTSYAKYLLWHNRELVGHVFQGRYQCKLITDWNYYDQVLAYIHNNPVADGLAEKPAEWPYSSANPWGPYIGDPSL